MARTSPPLNERQRASLRLIGDGDDLSGDDRVGLRISARSLASRGLVTVRRTGGKWQATITEAGRDFLDRDGAQPGDTTRASELGSPPRQQRRVLDADAESNPGPSARMRPAVPGARRQEALSLVEQLVRERRIVVPSPNESEREHWRKTIHYAKRYELVPEGEFIECTKAGRGGLVIALVASVHPNAARKSAAALAPVPVPQRLDRLHLAVARLRDDAGKLAMPKQLRHRALLLLQALAAAAEERGWQVRDRSAGAELHYSGIRRQSEHREGWIWVVVEGYSYRVTIDQEFPQTLDAVKSQSLKIELPHTRSGSRCRWADRKTGTLEDRLPEVIDGLATRAAEDRERAAIEEQEAAERQRAREKAETDAHSKALRHFYAETLYQQVSAFERMRAISAYCDAFEEQIAAADPAAPELESAAEWLEWARSHAAEIDPLRALPTMPAAPVFTAEQLAPHPEESDSSVRQRNQLRSAQSEYLDPALMMMLQLQAEKSSFSRWHPHV
ncbi:hypothetical protein [Glycomyces albidus]|uniref:Uncharacterized protein n=1 Tax=Glycomyces albidus TaxID=2656774 RepID=A0A6L5G7R9_9ACTN|nr:hypothetical protein [Glycomyces albidus]MQM25653.1 hypothetical protein [Glycomyces albidus]